MKYFSYKEKMYLLFYNGSFDEGLSKISKSSQARLCLGGLTLELDISDALDPSDMSSSESGCDERLFVNDLVEESEELLEMSCTVTWCLDFNLSFVFRCFS